MRDTDGGLVYSGTTNESGAILFGAIAPGDYTVTNTYTPEGYDPVATGMNPQSIHVSQGQQSDISLLFESSVQPQLIIHYMETESGLPVPVASLL